MPLIGLRGALEHPPGYATVQCIIMVKILTMPYSRSAHNEKRRERGGA